MTSDQLRRVQERLLALSPEQSVVVEACAGSGKTWLLSSRLLRLLLAGVKPGEILAITYTRKAAREIEARLRGLLADLAGLPDGQALDILTARGLSAAEAAAALPRARGLFEWVLRAQPAMCITTFHGWFARLLGAAPLDSGVAGRSLDEAAGNLLEEAWAALSAACAREPNGALAQSLLWLYEQLGAHATGKLMRAVVDRRAEWQVWQAEMARLPDGARGVDAWLDAFFGAQRDPLDGLFASWRLDELDSFARLLGQNTSSDQELGMQLADALQALRQGAAPEHALAAVRAAFLTASDAPRARKASAAQAKRLGADGEALYLTLHAQWSERLIDALGALQDRRNAEFNRHALRVGEALMRYLEELKRSRRVMDFTDLEAQVDRLLADEGTGAWLQARLDARYRHILLDEFQDTNPLQWRILRAWLDAYTHGGVSSPKVFLVGDPKQSIYRFRRAEPRLFAAAGDYFVQHFGALRIGNAHTFRNAGGVVELVNAVFDACPGFGPQTTERQAWPARIELQPLIPVAEVEPSARDDDAASMRRPLQEPRIDPEDQRRVEEARLIARRLGEIVGRWMIGPSDHQRPARYADVLILTRRKTQLGIYEAALREAGIPFVSPGQGGLLQTLEAQDLLAVLRFLSDPSDKLALAHALRTPAFALDEQDLLALSAEEGPWWPALLRLQRMGYSQAVMRAVDLLAAWMDAAGHLPAHDLIDRIFHESDWFARNRSAVPPALWPGVHANLHALLELALSVDAGRYPSLTRFVDELKRLSVSDEEAPDEGLVAAGAGQGRVRIMTVHGAKGLEAPIVWLIDANAPSRPADGYTVALDWPAESTAPRHFSLLGRMAEAGPARAALLDAEKQAAEREDLNLLYVALTRAEQVLIVSGVANARKSPTTTAYQRIEAALQKLGLQDGARGALPSCDSPVTLPASTDQVEHAETPLPAGRRVGVLRQSAQASAGEDRTGLEFGTAMHAWLEAYAAAWPLPEVPGEVEQVARRLAVRAALQQFFDPRRYLRAGNETSFIDSQGKPGRIDRWVETEDAVWVLDYKSGHADPDMLEEYREQLTRYRVALQQMFPHKTVRAMLVFTDGDELEVR